ETLWFYGPWFHILVTLGQSLDLFDHWTTRHVLTFLLGLAAIAALLPIARLAGGRWAGIVAIGLCLTTGYLYGSMFYTPIDVPFMFAMTWSTLAIMLMAVPIVPLWPATIATGLLTGLAMATPSSGLITHVYLIGAMILCGLEAIMRDGRSAGPELLRIGVRTIAAMAIAWLIAIALWPWLQVGNPITQFKEAFVYFAHHPSTWHFPHWGEMVLTSALPWSYVPAQLFVRLPEGFLLLLGVGVLSGIGSALATLRLVPRTRSSRPPSGKYDRELRVQRGTRIIELLVVLGFRSSHENVPRNDANFGIGPLASGPRPRWPKLKEALLLTAQARQALIVWAAA